MPIEGLVDCVAPDEIRAWAVDPHDLHNPRVVRVVLNELILDEFISTAGRSDIDNIYGVETKSRISFKPPAKLNSFLALYINNPREILKLVVSVKDGEEWVPLPFNEGAEILLRREEWVSYFRLPPSGLDPKSLCNSNFANLKNALVAPVTEIFLPPAAFTELFFDPLSYYLGNPQTLYSANESALFLSYHERTYKAERPYFDEKEYKSLNPDVVGIDPKTHYLRHGQYEGRTLPSYAESHISRPDRFSRLLSLFARKQPDSYDVQERAIAKWWSDFSDSRQAAAALNSGWYGEKKLESTKRLKISAEAKLGEPDDLNHAFAAGSRILGEHFYSKSAPSPEDMVSSLVIELRKNNERREYDVPSPSSDGVSIITPFFKHLNYFEECAASVALLIQATKAIWPALDIEWVVANDDPKIPTAKLLELISPEILDSCKVLETGGLGTTEATSFLMKEAKFGWFFFLDCDDIILPDAITVINHYARHTSARYISSGLIDIDELSRVIRYRIHSVPATDAPRIGMVAGHLKAIHRSVFDRYGDLDANYNSCQDYEFVLRLIDVEPICLIPEYLYCYRWHKSTQSTSNYLVQRQRAVAAKLNYVRPEPPRNPKEGLDASLGVIIRTQGERPLDLAEAIISTRLEQTGRIHPVVVVHGGLERKQFVKSVLFRFNLNEGVDVIHAPLDFKSRGYPIDVGMDYAFNNLNLDVVYILDDDDIFLPGAIEMLNAISLTRSEVWFGRTLCRQTDGNVREVYKLRPAAALVIENFMPTNGYIVNRMAYDDVKQRFGAYAPHDMHYLEDWLVLLRLLSTDSHFGYWDGFVGEFRMGSDGNTANRTRPFEFSRCQAIGFDFAQGLIKSRKFELARSLHDFPQIFARELDANIVDMIVETLG